MSECGCSEKKLMETIQKMLLTFSCKLRKYYYILVAFGLAFRIAVSMNDILCMVAHSGMNA